MKRIVLNPHTAGGYPLYNLKRPLGACLPLQKEDSLRLISSVKIDVAINEHIRIRVTCIISYPFFKYNHILRLNLTFLNTYF
jgi:hypothetical protein